MLEVLIIFARCPTSSSCAQLPYINLKNVYTYVSLIKKKIKKVSVFRLISSDHHAQTSETITAHAFTWIYYERSIWEFESSAPGGKWNILTTQRNCWLKSSRTYFWNHRTTSIMSFIIRTTTKKRVRVVQVLIELAAKPSNCTASLCVMMKHTLVWWLNANGIDM